MKQSPSVKPLSPNYITPRGLQKLKDELRGLINNERPSVVAPVAWAASNGFTDGDCFIELHYIIVD